MSVELESASLAPGPRTARRWPRACVAALVALLALKLVWVAALPICARWALLDDALFVRQAYAVCHGDWLGPYDHVTLIKGPFYALFIALCHVLHLPLSLAQHLLYSAMCVLAVVALRPLIRSTGLLVLIFGLCLFNPLSFHTWTLSGVTREGIYPALSGLVLVCAAAMLIRRDGPVKRLALWALALGLALGAFWLTREEGLCLLPSLLLLVAAGVWPTLRSRPPDMGLRLAAWLLPFGITGVLTLAVCALNRAHYGVFTVTELKHPDFTAAYGALARVGQGQYQEYVVLPKVARLRLYDLSPAFRELQPYLDGDRRVRRKAYGPQVESAPGEIRGGVFLWTLREAVKCARHCGSAPEALAYYRRLAQEVNAACDQGLIPCGAPCASLTPPWNPAYRDVLFRNACEALSSLVTWNGFRSQLPYSGGEPWQRALFQSMTGSTLTASLPAEARGLRGRERAGERNARRAAVDDALHAGSEGAGARLELLSLLGFVFQRATPLLVLAAVAAWGLQCAAVLRGRRSPLLLVSGALLLALVVRLALLVYIQATSFDAFIPRYMAPLGPLLLLFCGVSLAGAAQALAVWRRPAGVAGHTEGALRPAPR
ncbi:MAG: hypothetical protein EXS08_12840 [Planctomycetes bacterium]|nr:hypothetical protein [Planctomycetota bacterium]